MDIAEDEGDVKLQRASADLLADLESSLDHFLWKTTPSGGRKVRRRVRARETERLISLLEPFQELPQLLDPHLDKLVPVLSNAFLTYLRASPTTRTPAHTTLLIPLSKAISKLLYTFCKIRGEKVIVRFFSTEIRHLELLLSTIEKGNEQKDPSLEKVDEIGRDDSHPSMAWEERYVVLLWLSQLLLAPFDLSSISSGNTGTTQVESEGLAWPRNVPGVALRVVPIAIRYLSSSGKERDAAKILLVRIAVRRDMQELGILQTLVKWAISRLQPFQADVVQPAYHYIGVLSFLAGVLVSSVSTTDMDQFLPEIFQLAQDISEAENVVFKNIHGSAVARKTIIKVIRTIAVLDLRDPSSNEGMGRIEATISNLLEYISDPSTPVRLAASKALSVVTLKLHQNMAADVVQAVIDSLDRGILWLNPSTKDDHRGFTISNTNEYEWHGLIMTLSHLLYRRSVPPATLRDIVPYLAIGLSFEKRSTSGSSVGTNVRDAACFGIWALARRYTTAELGAVNLATRSLSAARMFDTVTGVRISTAPALQSLATELVVSACLDPAGNIRRGASAALQELIGRHPDTIEEGIKVVQVVDYHSVALRSRAIQECASHAAALSYKYYEGLKLALLGWRGVQDNEASVRRNVAAGFGAIVLARRESPIEEMQLNPLQEAKSIIENVATQFLALPSRDFGEAHGLLLSLASVIAGLNQFLTLPYILAAASPQQEPTGLSNIIESLTAEETNSEFALGSVFIAVGNIFEKYKSSDLLAEATSRLMIAIYPVIRASLVIRYSRDGTPSAAKAAVSSEKDLGVEKIVESVIQQNPVSNRTSDFTAVVRYLKIIEPLLVDSESLTLQDNETSQTSSITPRRPLAPVSRSIIGLQNKFLALDSDISFDAVSQAAVESLFLSNQAERTSTILGWVQQAEKNNRSGEGKAYLHALCRAYPVAAGCLLAPVGERHVPMQDRIADVLQSRWKTAHQKHDTETCKTILSCLSESSAVITNIGAFVNIIEDGLDDYTTNARGDVGSHLRIEALKSVGSFWSHAESVDESQDIFENLFGRVLRLAVEKLDKVRLEAQSALCRSAFISTEFALHNLLPSSQAYFRFFLEMNAPNTAEPILLNESWVLNLLEGFVTSADTGSEELVRASRAALVEFCDNSKLPNGLDLICTSLFQIMNRNISNNDRVLVSTMEVMSFLFDMHIMQKSSLPWPQLHTCIQKSHWKTTNVRKLEAAVKLYSGLSEVYPKALEKLTSMLLHPYPKIRNLVVEELFVCKGLGKGIDWVKAGKGDVGVLKGQLGLV